MASSSKLVTLNPEIKARQKPEELLGTRQKGRARGRREANCGIGQG